MKYLLCIILSLSAICNLLSSATFGSLEYSETDNPSISLAEGDVLEVLSLAVSGGREDTHYIRITSNSGINLVHLSVFYYSLNSIAHNPVSQGPIVGPCVVSLIAASGENCRMSYKLTRAPNPQPAQATTPAN